jgi:hypothetical protein
MSQGLKTIVACATALVVVAGAAVLRSQTTSVEDLRQQLRERYDIVSLQDGIGLVPLRHGGDVRLIEIRDGAVSINGSAVTARDLRQRLGRDADLVIRVTYLDTAALQRLSGPSSTASPPPIPSASPESSRENEASARSTRSNVRHGDVVRIAGSVTVGADETVEGDVTAIGGSADIQGEVNGQVTVIGGTANLGPDAHIHGDVHVVGGTLNRAPGARIDGRVDEVGMGGLNGFGSAFGRRLPNPIWWGTFVRVGSLIGTLVRIAVLAMLMVIVVALGARHVEGIADQAATDPWRSGIVGLLAEILFLPLIVATVIFLAVSVIGLPLLVLVPFGIVMALVLMLVGFTGVAYHVGGFVNARFGRPPGLYPNILAGLLAIVALSIVARLVGLLGGFVLGGVLSGSLAALGYLVEYVAWTVGTGAVVLAWLSTRRKMPASGTTGVTGPPVNETPAE